MPGIPSLVPVCTQAMYFTYLSVFLWTITIIFLQDSTQASHPQRHLSFVRYMSVASYILVEVQDALVLYLISACQTSL